MEKKFKVGDKVSWNYQSGQVHGEVIKIHKSDFEFKDGMHRASEEEPQYEVKSDKTDQTAAHKGSALTEI